MKHLLLLATLSLAPLQVLAQDAAPTTSTIQTSARKTEWATGLNDPQSIIQTSDGQILVTEYGAGRIARFDQNGKANGYAAQNLKSPAMMARIGNAIYISERKANRVIQLNPNGQISQIGGSIEEPLGIAIVNNFPVVVSHTQSYISRWDGAKWQRQFTASQAEGERYGYRCLASEPNGSLLMSDEIGGEILLVSPQGRLATWAKGFKSPSGIIIAPDGGAIVADEGAGTLSRVGNEGEITLIADGLGKPRGMVFIGDKTLLVTNRAGTVWKVEL